MDRIILHIDFNSFFATAEQQANPVLRGKPVGILKALGRTCIIAASVEAKKYGVKTGSDVYEAKKLCPGIILVPADFDKYADITYRFINICSTYSPLCEVFSLDECFVDVTDSERFWRKLSKTPNLDHMVWYEAWKNLRGKNGIGAVNIAYEIKKRIREEIGEWMKCSVGISHNKLLAKLASSQMKDDGFFWITDENALSVLDKSDLMDVCGLGFGLRRHLRELGIDNFKQIREKSFEFLQKYFGPFWSVHLYNIARGIDNSPVVPFSDLADAKSVGRTYTTHRNLTSSDEIFKLVRNLCEETAAKARSMGLVGRYVGLALRGGGDNNVDTKTSGWLAARSFSEGWYGHRTLKNYIDDGRRLFDLCCSIAKNWPIKSIRFCGVTLGMLTKSEYLPFPLLPTDLRRQTLITTIDKVNKRFGDYTIFPGQLLGIPIIRPEVNGYFGDKAFRLIPFKESP